VGDENQGFDFTIRADVYQGYKDKINKYKHPQLKEIIPIVVSYDFTMHAESVKKMARYIEIPTLFQVAYHLSAM
jgi:Cys-tRNA synthase (O-phospho-L-seryl-tRNA:Cys-tRNA synthase)